MFYFLIPDYGILHENLITKTVLVCFDLIISCRPGNSPILLLTCANYAITAYNLFPLTLTHQLVKHDRKEIVSIFRENPANVTRKNKEK